MILKDFFFLKKDFYMIRGLILMGLIFSAQHICASEAEQKTRKTAEELAAAQARVRKKRASQTIFPGMDEALAYYGKNNDAAAAAWAITMGAKAQE
jgi:hypothetical protein